MTGVGPIPQPALRTRDMRWHPSERDAYTWYDKAWLRLIRDERDLIFVRRGTNMSLFVIASAILLFWLPSPWTWVVGALYVPTLFIRYMGRFILMLHATSHRPLFKRNVPLLGSYIPMVLGPFFGQTPTAYYVHHIGMHHGEENLLGDLSTTLCYRRDSFGHWLHYWARFFFLGQVHLVNYFRHTGKTRLLRRLIIGEVAWVAGLIGLCLISWQATFVVFVLPLLLIRVLMMSGNWAQHAFVDADDPANPYLASTTLINHRYNFNCYNDGYHVVHHIVPMLHWSEMPGHFEANLGEYAKNQALVFDGIGNNQTIWWLLMTKNYSELADHLLAYEGDERTREELIAMLKLRTRRTRGRIRGLLEFETSAPIIQDPMAPHWAQRFPQAPTRAS